MNSKTQNLKALKLKAETEKYLSAVGGAAGTLRAKGYDLSYLVKFIELRLGGSDVVALSALTEHLISDFVAWRFGLGESSATVERRLATIKHFFRGLAEEFAIKDPARRIRPPRSEKFKAAWLTQLELASLRRVLADESIRNRAIVEMLLQTGLRVQELCDLRVEQVNLVRKELQNVRGKGNTYFTLFISSSLQNVLQDYLAHREACLLRNLSGFCAFPDALKPLLPVFIGANVFTSARKLTRNTVASHFQISPKTVWRICREVLTAAGVRPDLAHPHALRHTAIKQVYDEFGIVVAARFGRHSNINTTRRYSEASADELRRAVEILG